ncbi:Zinc finger BED domain-containing protein RICESLEEPER 1 [Glycine soja]
MNEAISKPLCDDVIVSNDKIEEDDVENENESIELDKKKKRLGSQQLNVGNFIQGLVWVRMEKKRQNVMLVAKKKICNWWEKNMKRKSEDVSQMILDMQGKLKAKKVDKMVAHKLLCNLMIMRNLPFIFVKYLEFRALISYLCPEMIPISRNTSKPDMLRIYDMEKTIIKELFKIFNFRHMPPPHNGFELSKKINEFLHDWGIEKKVFSITLDNTCANDVMQDTLKKQLVLQNGLVCDGEFFHVRCCAYILNLIVQEGLKFSDIVASCGLCLDVPTRWNSTYLMFKSDLKYQHVFGSLHLIDENYKYCPLEEEWKRAEKICRFLLLFYDITTLIFGTSYLTSTLKDEDKVIKDMAELMMEKFVKYWDEYSIVLAFSAIFDPRMKLETLGYCYEKIDPFTWEIKLEKVKSKLYMFFSQYSSKGYASNELKLCKLQVANKIGRSQLDTYLDEPSLDFDFTEHMDILR